MQGGRRQDAMADCVEGFESLPWKTLFDLVRTEASELGKVARQLTQVRAIFLKEIRKTDKTLDLLECFRWFEHFEVFLFLLRHTNAL